MTHPKEAVEAVERLTRAEIAARLTPAQVRALREPDGCDLADFDKIDVSWVELYRDSDKRPHFRLTELGRAVLAALDTKP
jgi:hypothetical protein